MFQAEGEVAALQRRIQVLEKDLEKSEKSLKIATEELDIVCQEFDNKDDNRFDVILFDFEWGSPAVGDSGRRLRITYHSEWHQWLAIRKWSNICHLFRT